MTTIPAGILIGPAREVFDGIVRHYKLRPHALLRAILELMLDAASEEGGIQQQLAECALECVRTDRVPGCWLELEGGNEDAEPDDDAGGGDVDEDLDTGEQHDLARLRHAVVSDSNDASFRL